MSEGYTGQKPREQTPCSPGFEDYLVPTDSDTIIRCRLLARSAALAPCAPKSSAIPSAAAVATAAFFFNFLYFFFCSIKRLFLGVCSPCSQKKSSYHMLVFRRCIHHRKHPVQSQGARRFAQEERRLHQVTVPKHAQSAAPTTLLRKPSFRAGEKLAK